jgi:hypothetical protein
VRGPDGPLVEGAQIHAVEVVGAKRLLLAIDMRRIDDESYEVKIDFVDRAPRDLEFFVHVPGLGRTRKRLTLSAGDVERVDVDYARHGAITGVVVTAEGVPLPSLPVIAFSGRRLGSGLVTHADLNTVGLMTEAGAEGADWTVGRTEEDGRFSLDAFAQEGYVVYSIDVAWVCEQRALAYPGGEPVRLVAHKAHSITGPLVDRDTGEPIRDARVVLAVRAQGDTYMKELGAPRGYMRAAWKPEDEELLDGFTVEITITAPGYAPYRETVAYDRDERGKYVEPRMRALAPVPIGVVLLEVVDAAGLPVGHPAALGMVRPEDAWIDLPDSAVEDLPEGRFRVKAATGPWRAYVRLRWVLGDDIAWSGRVVVEAGPERKVRCPLPPFGTIRVRRTRLEGGATLTAHAPDLRHRVERSFDRQEMVLAASPGTAWILRMEDAPEHTARRVTVVEGSEVVIDLAEE